MQVQENQVLEHDHHQAQRGWRFAGAVLTAAARGLVMIVLKDLVLLHLH